MCSTLSVERGGFNIFFLFNFPYQYNTSGCTRAQRRRRRRRGEIHLKQRLQCVRSSAPPLLRIQPPQCRIAAAAAAAGFLACGPRVFIACVRAHDVGTQRPSRRAAAARYPVACGGAPPPHRTAATGFDCDNAFWRHAASRNRFAIACRRRRRRLSRRQRNDGCEFKLA